MGSYRSLRTRLRTQIVHLQLTQQQLQQPNQVQGTPTPITQEGEQDSESGEVDQDYEVS